MKTTARFANFTLQHIFHVLRAPLAILLLIALFECTVGNIPFWNSVTGSTDSMFAHNATGPGIERLSSGGLLITDPSESYLEVNSDGSSPYIQLKPSLITPKKIGKSPVKTDVHVRIDVNKIAGKPLSTNPRAISFAMLPVPDQAIGVKSTLRLWIQHPKGDVVDVEDAKANVRAPFSWNWGRVFLLIIISIFIALWNPWSKLWKIRLNTKSINQRLLLTLFWTPFLLIAIFAIFWNVFNGIPMHFDVAGNYTYDFDQYARTADALLKGKTHLDLPVPPQMQKLSNPYDPIARNNLLSDCVHNIYWDHAYYKGHWYSYFGVIPVVLFFIPYKIISNLWIPGGAMLPTTITTFICLIGFLIFGSLLVIRLIKRVNHQATLACVSICLTLFFITSNTVYLWFRTSFYSVPMAASLFFTSLGLWFYLGSIKDEETIKSHKIVEQLKPSSIISFKHIAAGSLFIAFNLGCRPTFIIAFLFAIPLFYTHFYSYIKNIIISDKKSIENLKNLLKLILCIIIPFIIVAIPIGLYNALRFGSPFNFGNEYQITITDMTTMRLPSQNIIPSILSYIALPIRFISTFPWIAIQPIAFEKWQYAEPMIGGMFTLSPLALLGIICVFTMTRNMSKIATRLAIISVISGIIVIVFDSLKAGIGWRYIADFAWLFALSAIIGINSLLQKYADITVCDTWKTKTLCYLLRFVIFGLLFFSIAIAFLSWFVPGREDSILRFNPQMWHTVRCWFTLI
ncbi:beta-carotene 15,15'-monooxygenase [Gardnerella vaginalis]|uniref:beta-carotene 15,15'-monooxygenase n=1 Tax=Gardnerella vaginalis TaxID=2702 RepID=UPI000C7B0FEE|nr:beta-carotene 15,15'-monooxygenase [Gardnerella vaginalis]PKZ58042.1 beta-carotene 15,15'-monooxygenase [Gardnerella vaginalis]